MSNEGRKELAMESFEHLACQVKFAKSRDSIVKKASELAELCDVDVGLLMFSSAGQLTSFASNGRIEDVFLRYFDHIDMLQGGCSEEVEVICRNLMHLKHEAAMIEKMARIEALEEKLSGLKQRQFEVERKLRHYSPHMDDITSVQEAEACRLFLAKALQNVDGLKEKLNRNVKQLPCASVKAPAAEVKDFRRWNC